MNFENSNKFDKPIEVSPEKATEALDRLKGQTEKLKDKRETTKIFCLSTSLMAAKKNKLGLLDVEQRMLRELGG
ncbi:MAG: hypothetical protein AAB465_01305 [Patescibacteria group bacterium]